MAFYVTTPIFYVNAAPHLGHAYTAIGADILARHQRQRGEEVFFLTGTDEHGEPVAQAAEAAGVTPKELADRNAQRFQDLMPTLNVSNDFFIRTSDERHKAAVQDILQRVHDNGHVYKGTYEGWYCPRCADFKTEQEIGPDNTCKIHLIPLTREQEENYFFRLSSFQEQLERLYTDKPDFVVPRVRYNEARSFITGGLQDVSLTRANLTWGVTVPWDTDHVFYVWFDALLNYVTALRFADPERDLSDTFWPATYHVIGKDILKFHCVFWPAMLLAAGYELPEHVFVHGFLLMNEHKMSKSLGNVLDPFTIIEQFGTDALRYYCFREVSFGLDGNVSPAGFEERYTSELANDYGNLASRTLNMLRRYADAQVPEAEPDPELSAEFADLPQEVCDLLDRAEVTQALERIWVRVRRLNRYVEEQAPWKLAKDPDQADHLRVVLRSLAEGLRTVTVLLHPYLPESTTKLLTALGDERTDVAAADFGAGRPGAVIGELAPLFPQEVVIDSHTHLDSTPGEDGEIVARAREAGVRKLLTIGTDVENSRAALAAAERFDGVVYAAVGWHPNHAGEYADEHAAELADLARDPRCRAIGETGLDYFRDYAPREDQVRAFAAQIEIARDTDKPLVIHTRAADDDTIATLARDAGGVTVILHCFSMAERLDECLEHGWYVSYAGNVTYPKSQALAATALRAPLDRILVETDAPYLTPQVVRKERNQPANVVHTARFIADARGIAYEELEAAVEANAARLFQW